MTAIRTWIDKGVRWFREGSGVSFCLQAFILLSLAVPSLVYGEAFRREGTREWYYHDGNDACQTLAAQAAAQRLGHPPENVIWPGATLSLPYLYRHLLSPAPATETRLDAVNLLSDAIHSLWFASHLYGVLFLWLFYLAGSRLGGGIVLAYAASLLLAVNPWFAFHTAVIRPEMLSLLWILAAACLCTVPANRIWRARPDLSMFLHSFLFAVCLGFAILSKIQIVPLLPPVLLLFLYARWSDAPASEPARGILRWIPWGLALLTGVTTLGFLKTGRIAGAAYGLGKYREIPGILACVGVILLLGLALAFHRYRKDIHAHVARNLIAGLSGLAAAVLFTAFPLLVSGGGGAFLTTVNRLLYGPLSYTLQGQRLSGFLGFGYADSVTAFLSSFAGFQTSHRLLGLGEVNLAVISVCAVAVCVFLSAWRSGGGECSRSTGVLCCPEPLAVWVLATALGFDMVSTLRTHSGGTPYLFYHIYTVPLYLLSFLLGLQGVMRRLPERLRAARSAPVPVLAGVMLAAVLLIPKSLDTSRAQPWGKPQAGVGAYLENIRIINLASPAFFRATGVPFESFQEYLVSGEYSHDLYVDIEDEEEEETP